MQVSKVKFKILFIKGGGHAGALRVEFVVMPSRPPPTAEVGCLGAGLGKMKWMVVAVGSGVVKGAARGVVIDL